jgi:hypothetical protein
VRFPYSSVSYGTLQRCADQAIKFADTVGVLHCPKRFRVPISLPTAMALAIGRLFSVTKVFVNNSGRPEAIVISNEIYKSVETVYSIPVLFL